MNRYGYALAGAVILSVVVVWAVLGRPARAPQLRPAKVAAPLAPVPPVAVDDILRRAPFASSGTTSEPEGGSSPVLPDDPADPPRLVGIVGRLPDRAVVLVRRPEGGTRTLSLGEASGEWRLISIGADAALFASGTRRVRVELPKSPGDQ